MCDLIIWGGLYCASSIGLVLFVVVFRAQMKRHYASKQKAQVERSREANLMVRYQRTRADVDRAAGLQ